MKVLINNSIWSILEMATNAILSFGLSVFIGRFYGIEDLGVYSFVASTSAIVVAMSNFGVTPYYIKCIAQSSSARHHINELINIRLLISTPLYAIMTVVIILSMIKDSLKFDHISLLVLFGLVNINMLLASVFNSQQRNGESFVCSLMYKLGAFLVMLLVILHDALGFSQFIILLCLIAITQTYFVLRYKMVGIDLKSSRRRLLARIITIRKTFAIGLAGIFEAITNRIDILIIGYFISESSMGAYSAAYSYFMIYILFSLALTKVFFARFSFYCRTNIKLAIRFLKIYATLSFFYALFASVILYASAEIFIKYVYGEEFTSSTELVRGLSFCVMPMIMGRLFGHVMNAVGSFNYAIYTAALGAIVSVFCNLALIGEYQIWAPVYATFAAEMIVLLVLLFLVFKVKIFRRNICT
ncbi:MAG: oligosaccharide flippase family protein [Limnohabitans sp.]|jgi:O-antigen/teichoic acid export membrane protein|uniref:oligosaccharide flippase family protein n=1 Tax=Limnohabitans sp. TaxID=1907725 RepID=UPI00391A4931